MISYHATSNKIYDFTGFICGRRLYRIMLSGRLKPAISAWIEDFLQLNFYPSHLCARAVHDGLPADFLAAREVVGGLYYA